MLIAFEGLHTAGKSTQVDALVRWLGGRVERVVKTAWNSSPPLGASIGRLKSENRVGPLAMVLMEAADLAYRFEEGLRNALSAGGVVVADRWFYSTIVRAVPRGVDEQFVRSCFAFAPRPDIVFHVRCTAQETLNRRVARALPLRGHLVGEDLTPGLDPRTGYLVHQGEAALLYDRVLPQDAVVLPCAQSPDALQARVVAALGPLLAGRPRVPTASSSGKEAR
ncbi:dTMP kinase [Micromonospora tulbaghiae]|uniref:dTMP kinase n=1 Tax=Micromonospora tulbaghiae TaxID=479978 RepID=UPI0034012783